MGSKENVQNPLKRSFDCLNSTPEIAAEAMDIDKDRSFTPKNSEVKIFEVAMRRNTIAVLETGADKTRIAAMMIREFGQSLKNNGEKKLIIFLAPTVALIQQGCEVIKCQTELRVEEIFGAKGVDDWSRETWEKQIDEHDVLFMTPQILLDALRKAFLTLDVVYLIILDECHRATGNHPYAKIMKDFYHEKSRNKPKVFGMTPSSVIRKGVTSAKDCEQQITELESLLDSRICTAENRVELEESVPPAKEIYRFYDSPVSSTLKLKEKMELSLLKFDAVLLELQRSCVSPNRDTDDKFKMLQRRLSNDHANILCCLENLGLICAYEAVKICQKNAPDVKEDCEIFQKGSSQCSYFLEEVASIIQESLPQNYEVLLPVDYTSSDALSMGYVSSKLQELLGIFKSFGKESTTCLTLVERTITAKVIEIIIKKITYLSHFSVSFMTGSNSSVDALAPNVQKETLVSFPSGKVNLLFTTDVEDGSNVPHCSFVIWFDQPKTVHSNVQSLGRARQSDSQYIMMLERGNLKQRDNFSDISRSELPKANTAMSRDYDSSLGKDYTVKETDAYCVEATGVSVAAGSSVSLIQRYCDKLPRDKFFTPKPIYQFLLEGQLYRCQLTLPPSAAFQTMIGPATRSTHLSKQLVCLEACKKLHQLGSLNDYLLPLSAKNLKNDSCLNGETLTAGTGTTKRKELHGTTRIQALSGTWSDKLDGFLFQAYKMDFTCNIKDQHYSSFVLLLESKLDDDVGNIQVELYLLSKFVKSSVSAYGQIYLDQEQVTKAKCFQEFFFNGLFGKLFVNTSGERKFLLETQEALWDPSKMYLLLPLESLPNCAKSWDINWRGIESCVSVVEFLKENAWLNAQLSESGRKRLLVDRPDPVRIDAESTNIIHLANESVCLNKLVNMVVVSIHTGRIYSIMQALENSSAESPFDGNSDPESPSYSSFADYFNKRYGIVLVHPGQPLLLLKQSHNPHNLLVDFKNESIQDDREVVVQKPRYYAHMPPELLISIDVPIHVLKSFYLLPSLMHRLESLMLASQLRKNLVLCSDNLHVSSSLILEALTTLKCNEIFSMERLELLGDSVIKYSVSCHLFLKYPKKHEGELTAQRSWAVCNSTLHKLGTERKLQSYIRDGAFEPRRWTAPGQRSLWPCACDHGVDSEEVPLDKKFVTEDTKVKVGKSCDRGHRWMGSKTISDCVEALIGAYYVGGGLIAALDMMKWIGINAETDPALVHEAIKIASLHVYSPKVKDIEILEGKLGYEFRVKGLLLEAMTHATEQEQDASLSYQRLEFLGDSVLDILITCHLYYNHSEIDPGEMTDLRAASVNNDSFALAAVKKNLYLHLQHCSEYHQDQISTYVKSVSDSINSTKSIQVSNAPKVLGDIIESIAGAILIDTKLNLDEVWRIFEPLLSPIVTPDKLELPPQRELIELCDSLGYFIKESCTTKGDEVMVELSLQLEDVLLIGKGSGRNKKAARGQAAFYLLKELEERGISNSKRLKEGTDVVCNPLPLSSGDYACVLANAEDTEVRCSKRQQTIQLHQLPDKVPPLSTDLKEVPVVVPVDMKKGGPRSTLFALCRKQQWPMPTFDCSEIKSRTPMVFGEGSERRTGFNSYESKITLTIPNSGAIVVTGKPRADKKSSYDSAALTMLLELQGQGKIVIGEVEP